MTGDKRIAYFKALTIYFTALAILLSFLSVPAAPAQEDDQLQPTASSYLVQSQGEILWAHNPDRRRPPASLTKIMTAYLVLKHADLNEVATVSPRASRETGTRLGLKKGERMTVGNLLAATMLKSANDACHVLADHVAGTEFNFVRMMNKEAKALGMRNTRFANACGHDNRRHYSTARDLALLADEALKNPVFASLVSTETKVVYTEGGERIFFLINKNELLGSYQGAMGVKTGFTRRAGKCLVAAAQRNGTRVLLVLLNSPNRWISASALLDEAFTKLPVKPVKDIIEEPGVKTSSAVVDDTGLKIYP